MTSIAVIGAGKMGLPLACKLASRGGRVVSCDINPALVAAINAGEMPFDEPGVAEVLSQAVGSGALRATTDLTAVLPDAEVVIVIIPVLLTSRREADLDAIESVTQTISEHLHPGQMVSYETTIPVGTTRNRLRPILERSGYRAGIDFDLAFSPERVKSRLVLRNLSQVPKIVGGVNALSASRAERFYATYLAAPVTNLGSLEAAEFAKLAGMVYRDVNIALANELAEYAEQIGVDFRAVAAAANTDGESALLTPGIGVGGHCTPVYPYFLLQHGAQLGLPMPITAKARAMNDAQAGRMLDRLCANDVRLERVKVLILGLGFRPEVKEHTLSPAFLIRDEAERRGAVVFLHDPLYTDTEIRAHGFRPFDFSGENMPPIIVLNTAHSAYAEVDFAQWRERGVQTVLDGRAFWNPDRARQAGLEYFAPGSPSELVPILASREGVSC